MANVVVNVTYLDNERVSFIQYDTSIETVIHRWDVIAKDELDEEKSIGKIAFRSIQKQTMF